MLLPKASRAACQGWAEGAGSHSLRAGLADGRNSPQGLEEGAYLGHQAQRGLVQSQDERPQILQSL